MIFSTIQFIALLIAVLLIFNLMIAVHELGHFLAARWRGLYVDRFAVWFGKPIWKKKIGDVTYILGCIPAGGYVSIPQLAPMEAIEGKIDLPDGRALPPVKPIDKIIVAFAGPLFSLLLAFVFAIVVWAVGKPVDKSQLTTVIGYVEKEAKTAGLLPGDNILRIDGQPVLHFGGMLDSVQWAIISSQGDTIAFEVERDGKPLPPIQVKPNEEEQQTFKRRPLRTVGIAPEQDCLVTGIMENSPAQRAGFKEKDILLSIDGTKVHSIPEAIDQIKAKGEMEMALAILRDGQRQTIQAKAEKPIEGPDRPMLGLDFGQTKWDGLSHPAPTRQIIDCLLVMRNTIKAIFSPRSKIGAQHLSGPVGIGNAYYTMLTVDQGWRLVLWFSVFLNVNLAVMNLLPFPVLDGGHITMGLLEMITRRPLSQRILEPIQTVCVVALLGFMAFVTFYDVSDRLPSGQAEKPAREIRFAPPKPPE